MAENFQLSSPWVLYVNEIKAFFKGDKDVEVIFDEDTNTVKLLVNGAEKADALTQLLPAKKQFGNVTLTIQIIPANRFEPNKLDLFRKAFADNPIVTDYISIPKEITGFANDFNYLVFKKEVVQYHNDSLNDPHGNCSTLYQNIAEEVFDNYSGVYFCTDKDMAD